MKTVYRSRRKALMMRAAAPALALALVAGGAGAQESKRAFEIAPQPLADALLQFSSQADIDIVAAAELTRGRTAPRVSGELTTAEAMNQLLVGSGLEAQPSGGGYVLARAEQDPQSESAAGGGAEVDALIVTAQKREEDIQDVPIAISAFTQEQLDRSQVAGGPDLMTQVPNMTFTKTNFTSYSIQLRGIGTQAISATTDAAVAVAFNNTPFIRNRFFEQEFYDLQRVEVLRGPQGTLYGRNATAGVVNLISNKPKFAYEARASGDISNYNSSRLEGMLNIPLAEDVAALRIAGAWTKRNGYVTNEITGNPIDGRDLWSTRMSLRFSPNDRIDANLIWEHFEEDDDRLRSGKQLCETDLVTEVAGFATPNPLQGVPDFGQDEYVQAVFSQGCRPASLYAPDSFQVPSGLALPYYHPLSRQALPDALDNPYASTVQSQDLRVIESTVDPIYRAKSDVVELQFAYDISDNLTLASETAYSTDEIFSTQDFNRFNTEAGAWELDPDFIEAGIIEEDGSFCDPQIGCSDRLVGIDVSTAKSKNFSQELRLSSNFDGPVNFSLGANYLRYDTEDKYYVFFNSLTLYAATTAFGSSHLGGVTPSLAPPYEMGVTDNQQCLPAGYRSPKPEEIQSILGCVYIDPNPVTSLNDLGHNYFLSRNPYKLISYAAFGELYYQIAEKLKVTGGFRWTVDQKEAPRIPSWVLAADTAGYPVAEVVEQEWQEPTGRLAIDWKPDLGFTDETLLYASFAHGYKAGGMNPPPAGVVLRTVEGSIRQAYLDESGTHPKTFEPEFVNAFELGSKNTLLDGALTLNMAAFYYDYEGYQISQIVNRSAVNLNFDADIWGLELESDWRPAENLRLGLKLGYENTKVTDGMRAIDTMDRTAGNPDWVLVRPFPALPSNCILPAWLMVGHLNGAPVNPQLVSLGGASGGSPGGCEYAYILGMDPATGEYYTPNPYLTDSSQRGGRFRTDVDYAAWSTDPSDYPCLAAGLDPATMTTYPGVDAECLAALSNNGQGFYKDISGNELPNAPSLTATLTADYTIPLPNDWLATLHTDLYYQSEAWTRIFNTEGYDKLKAYTNVNLAAIFTNEPAGWKVMAYIKNVFDRDSITGAFLNSDDTGLTTNVFLTEPRLYGLRVTKEWTGGPWWIGANLAHKGPFPLTVEIGGQVQRHDAPIEEIAPAFMPTVPAHLQPNGLHDEELDWGDGREARVTYRPGGSAWKIAAAVRYGRTNTDTARSHVDDVGEKRCNQFYESYIGQVFCNPDFVVYGYPTGYFYNRFGNNVRFETDWSDGAARQREEHSIVDFEVGRDFGLGGIKSSVSAGLRRGEFKSDSAYGFASGDQMIPDGFQLVLSHEQVTSAEFQVERRFEGFGPIVTWEASAPLWRSEAAGSLALDWSVTGGVLFGDAETEITGQESVLELTGFIWPGPFADPDGPEITDVSSSRKRDVTVPLASVSLGASYDVGRVKVGAGYRWERYFDAVDGGFSEERMLDRTLDGPYFKLSVGFGG